MITSLFCCETFKIFVCTVSYAKMSFYVLSRNFSTSSVVHSAVKNLVVVGGGLMGAGIGQVAAQAGINVTIVEVNDTAVKKTNDNIRASVQRVAKKIFKDDNSKADNFISATLAKLNLTLDLEKSVNDANLVIEAVVENIDLKQKIFSRIDTIAPSKTIFASNTSSLLIQEISSVTQRKDRFIGLHFFNPVPVMKLLEVVRTPEVSEETYNTAIEFGKAIGKVTITCRDTPGFVVNRLLIPFIGEAFAMLERGDASARDIDTAMKLGAGYPMGPFELADYVGLDTSYYILKGWQEKYPDYAHFKPSKTVEKLVKEGKFGIKTGEGIYSYKK